MENLRNNKRKELKEIKKGNLKCHGVEIFGIFDYQYFLSDYIKLKPRKIKAKVGTFQNNRFLQGNTES